MEDCRPSRAWLRNRLKQIPFKKRCVFFAVAVVIIASTITAVWALDRLERGVVLEAYTDKTHYESGESVLISLQLKNYGFSSVKLVYGSSLVVRFSIYNSDNLEVFTGPREALMVITEVNLEPGGVKKYEYTWNQTNNSNEQVDLPDSFTVRAISWSYERYFHANATLSVYQD